MTSLAEQFRNRVVAPQSSGLWVNCREVLGHPLVILKCHSIGEEADPMNKGQLRQVAVIDYVDLSLGVAAPINKKAKVDKLGVVNKLDPQSRDIVVGRMVQGEAKVGQNPPFILDKAEDSDLSFFLDQWLPAHEAELSGAESAAPAAPAPGGSAPMPTVATAPQHRPGAPAPVAAPAVGAPVGAAQMTPEAQAALAGMIARGELPGMTLPVAAPHAVEPPF